MERGLFSCFVIFDLLLVVRILYISRIRIIFSWYLRGSSEMLAGNQMPDSIRLFVIWPVFVWWLPRLRCRLNVCLTVGVIRLFARVRSHAGATKQTPRHHVIGFVYRVAQVFDTTETFWYSPLMWKRSVMSCSGALYAHSAPLPELIDGHDNHRPRWHLQIRLRLHDILRFFSVNLILLLQVTSYIVNIFFPVLSFRNVRMDQPISVNLSANRITASNSWAATTFGKPTGMVSRFFFHNLYCFPFQFWSEWRIDGL